MPRFLEIVEWENFNDGRNDKNVQDSSLDRAKKKQLHTNLDIFQFNTCTSREKKFPKVRLNYIILK